MNILITNPGRKNYFLDFLLDIKKKYINKLNIHIADISNNCSTFHMNKSLHTHILPSFKNKKKYSNELTNLVKKNQIKLIIPVTDLDLRILSELKRNLNRINCVPIISDKEIINVCINKRLTFNFLKKNQLQTPEVYNNVSAKTIRFPVILKDLEGNGSKGLQLIEKSRDLISKKTKKKLIQKFIYGQEYNLDILNDLKGQYLDHCCKLKIEMRDGETFKAKIVKNKKIDKLAKVISKKLKHIGNLDCDLIFSKKKFYILDLNPRFGGGYAFTHISGKNYLLKILKLTLNEKYTVKKIPEIIIGMKSLNLNYYKC